MEFRARVTRDGNRVRVVVGDPTQKDFKFVKAHFTQEQQLVLTNLKGYVGRYLDKRFQFVFTCKLDCYPDTRSQVESVLAVLKEYKKESDAIDLSVEAMEADLNK